MKYIICAIFIFCFCKAHSQVPVGVPTQKINGWAEAWYYVPDSGVVAPKNTPTFTPRFPGTMITYQTGSDTSIHYWTGLRWIKISLTGIDTTSLSNRINLKLNISDTAAMLTPYLRKADTTNKWVQNMYARSDSLFKQKNGAETFVGKFSTTGTGTVTSVALSMPSAFTVTGSPITGAGTLSVSGNGTSLQYIRGNGTLAMFDTAAIPNFYLKVRGLFSATAPITYNQTTGLIGVGNANTGGTKGVATFSSVDFLDNGLGLISLKNPITDVDVFLVAGQSNAVGHGDSTISPDVYPGYVLQINSGIVTNANDIVGTTIGTTANAATTGSAWPSFGITYYNLTSHKICFIPSARDGSSMASAANIIGTGTWDTTGVLFDSAVARVVNNMAALTAQGYNPIFKGVLWAQGETDGLAINSAAIVQATYTAAFIKMIRRFRQQFSYRMPFYIFRTGTYVGQQDSGFAQVRQAQQYVADNDSLTTMVFYNALDFPSRSLMKGDGVHYTQGGLNEMGTMGALAVQNNIKRIWQPQDTAIYMPNGRVGIGISQPIFKLQVKGTIGADTLSKSNLPGDSLIILPTTSTTFSGSLGMIILGNNSAYFMQSGNERLGIGTRRPDFGVDLHVKRAANNSMGIKIENTTAGNGSLANLAWFNDAGLVSQVYATSSVSSTFGASVFGIFGAASVRIGAIGDIGFTRSTTVSPAPFLTLKAGTNNFLYNGTTDNAALGKFQVYSTSVFDSAMRLNRVTAPPSTYNILVHGLTDSITYQVPITTFATGNTVYTGDGTLAADRNIASGGFTLRLSGANNSDTLMSIINTGTSSVGLFSLGSLYGVDAQGTTIGLRAFGSSIGMTAEGGTSEGAIIKSDAIRGATIQSVPATTNTVQEVIRLERGVNGSPGAAGIGGSADFYNKVSDNSSVMSNQIISKFTTATVGSRISQLSFTGVNAAVTGTILTIDGDGTFTTAGKRIVAPVTSSAGTLTIGNAEFYCFNGTTTTWTLPAVTGTAGTIYYLKNIGSGTITLNSSGGGNDIYSTTAVNTLAILTGTSVILISNGTYWTTN